MTSTEFWLVRHAKPVVAPGVCYGRLDVPADPAHTLASAQALAAALHAAPGHGPAPLPVWSSPRSRALALAQALGRHTPAGLAIGAPQVDDRLAEMDFGSWEGQRWDDLPQAALGAWTDDFHHHRPGGGEAVGDFLARVRAALDDVARRARQAGLRRVVCITHAGVMRAVDVWLAQTPTPLRAQDWPTAACEFGRWQVRHWPDPPTPG